MKLALSRKRWRLLLFGGLAATVVIVVFHSKPEFIPIRPFVQFLPADSRITPPAATLFERYVPVTWAWLWRLRDIVRGSLPSILIDCEVIECAGVLEEELAKYLPDPTHVETNGMRAWILDVEALASLRRQMETKGAGLTITRPRVQTSHGIQSSLSVGGPHPFTAGSTVGLAFDLLPLIQQDGTELMTVFAVTEVVTNKSSEASVTSPAAFSADETSVATNLAAAARWRLPDGTGFFILGPVVSNDSRRIGALVSPLVQRSRK